MDSRRFDAFARALARNLPRRGFFRAATAATAAAGVQRFSSRQAMAQESGSIALPCVPCNCAGEVCDCCIVGMAGGGVVRTPNGDVNLVIFTTQLGEGAPQQAAGYVRWLDPNIEGGLSLESIGPITYDWPEGEEHLRYIHGVMSINGEGEQPFVLEAFDAGPDKIGEDAARLLVGDATSESGASGFGYEAEGVLVGGDLQLLSEVAPITPAT